MLAELAAYHAAEKSDETTLVFHGDLSPCSNFHPSPFMIDGIQSPSAEHYIQYNKALLFSNSVTANKILKCDMPIDAKRLSYNITDFNRWRWIKKGYEVCAKGIHEKFIQNQPLLEMLKGMGTKTIVEASIDKLWGTGILL